MTSNTLVAGLVIVTVAVTVALIKLKPNALKRYWYQPIENGRTILGGLILAAGVVTFLYSGVAYLMLAALAGIAFAVTFVYYEEPHKDIR